MPEIPEIETIRKQLEAHVLGKTITHINVIRPKTLNIPPDEFVGHLVGQAIISAKRRAKIIVLEITNGFSLFFHFMLEGHVHLYYPDETVDGRPNLLITFDTSEKLAFYRMELGYVRLVPTLDLAERDEFKELGPEPLSPAFSIQQFHALLTSKKGMIKPLLMDQAVLAGIGNVYSNESLFCGRIMPNRKTPALSEDEITQLYHCIRDILNRSIAKGGVNDTQFSSDDVLTGGFTPDLQVAYRTGAPCYVCSHPIETKRIGGRNAFFCPVCQK